MRLTPRGEEVAEIAAILNGEHESAEACAKAVLKQVYDQMWYRDWHALVVTWPHNGVMFGPYLTRVEAEKHAADFKAPDFTVSVLPMRGLGKPEERLGGGFGYCATDGCGHPAYAHSMLGTSRGKCVLSTCNCGSYELNKPKPKKATRPRKATA